MTLNETAASGFSRGAAAYERGRPGYPPDAVERLVTELRIAPGRRTLDLAAGTGKLTRQLVPTGAEIVAVEPVTAMAEQLRAIVGNVAVFDATAESLPFEAETFDAVVVGQAFHWFDAERALVEIGRVLTPGGGLGLIWNERDARVPWVAELSGIVRWDERRRWGVPYTLEENWAARIDELDSPFGPVSTYETTFVQTIDTDTLVARVLSTSYLAAQPEDVQAEIASKVRELVANFDEPFELPYITKVYWCHRA